MLVLFLSLYCRRLLTLELPLSQLSSEIPVLLGSRQLRALLPHICSPQTSPGSFSSSAWRWQRGCAGVGAKAQRDLQQDVSLWEAVLSSKKLFQHCPAQREPPGGFLLSFSSAVCLVGWVFAVQHRQSFLSNKPGSQGFALSPPSQGLRPPAPLCRGKVCKWGCQTAREASAWLKFQERNKLLNR